jgi:hypothetical protein
MNCYITTLMMGTELVPETSILNQLTQLYMYFDTWKRSQGPPFDTILPYQLSVSDRQMNQKRRKERMFITYLHVLYF